MAPQRKAMNFLPIHEVLNHLFDPNEAETWCGISPAQEGFQIDLQEWGRRMGVDTTSGHWAGLGLWVDSAPSFKQDRVFLLTWRLLTGTVRSRYWLCCFFSKKEICQCGCFGRHTLDTIFAVAAWSMRALLAGQYP